MKTTTLSESGEKKTLLVKRSSIERGRTELGWLHSRHTFSFGNYFDPDRMGFRALLVINHDVVEPGQGFGGQWVHVIAGDLKVLGESLKVGDGLGIEHAAQLEFESRDNSQFLLFDLY